MNREELAMEETRLSESDVCAKYITPALHQAGWNEAQIRREVSFTKGRIIVRGKLVSRGEGKRADYVLYTPTTIPSGRPLRMWVCRSASTSSPGPTFTAASGTTI